MAAIEQLAKNKKERIELGKAGQVKIEKEYEAKKIIHQFTTLVNETLHTDPSLRKKTAEQNKRKYQKFHTWYTKFLQDHQPETLVKYSSSWMINLLVRIFNFVEFKCFNG